MCGRDGRMAMDQSTMDNRPRGFTVAAGRDREGSIRCRISDNLI